ncbi:GNAT family N-acetyltransferase [Litoribacillus peritrichatus]|uniref:GNAT family N-acetyltransferase n=1 Tax=Litoribacillus peritrichatus TaxID=718191 RepID=A0ABP7N4D1_9GAMM
MDFQIRKMVRKDLAKVIDWAAQEGWNPGLHDLNAFFDTDPTGFLVGVLNGEVIGSVSVVRYDDSFGFLGFYIVKPEHRGKGYGIKIWQAGMDYLHGCNVGLDGVVEQQNNYKKSGFEYAYANIRFQGCGGNRNQSIGKQCNDPAVSEYSSEMFDSLLAFDRNYFPVARTGFLKAWLNLPESRAFVHRAGEEVTGYGMIRKCREGYKIGPLFSTTPEVAEALYLALKANVAESESIYLDVPAINHHGMALAQKYNMTEVFETARMYTKSTPDINLDGVFGVTSFELG